MTGAEEAGRESGVPARGLRPRSLLRLAALLVMLVGLVLLGRRFGAQVPAFAARVEGLGAWGPAVFVLGYAVASVALIPGSLLTLGAGAIFGLGKGVALAFCGATLGAALAFLLSRSFARGAVERRMRAYPRFAAIDRAVGEQGLRIVFLLRLSPLFPFTLLNYALGLTRVRLRDYLLGSAGMLPGTFLYVYYGKLAGDVATLAGGTAPARGPGYWVVLGLGLLATLAVTALVARAASRAVRAATGEG